MSKRLGPSTAQNTLRSEIMEATRCRVALTFDRDFWIARVEHYDVGKA